jgi:hypothetical protein
MTRDIFGRIRLGYVLVESRRMDEWRHFGTDGLGLHLEESSRDVAAFRIDGHSRRLIVVDGPAEDVTALAWQVDDHDTLQEIVARLAAQGITVNPGDPEGARLRGVEHYWQFTGPRAHYA